MAVPVTRSPGACDEVGRMLTVEKKDGVASIVLDRPPVNAWDDGQLDAFEAALDAISGDETVQLAVVRGAGRHFSAGADIKMLSSAVEMKNFDALNRFAQRIQALFSEWAMLDIPTVAVLQGAVTGGGLELALACDLRIAADSARLGLPEVALGLVPAGGGTQRLTELVGRATAARLMFTGELMTGTDAREVGLVQWCVPETELQSAAEGLVVKLVSLGGSAQRYIKACIASVGDAGGYVRERKSQRTLHGSPETGRRLAAFVEERKKA